ncbi:MAG TPA: glycerophosphodiester phosphodiesterase [Bryobacteraceae bacterium]|nr:glycerophosphodiester phosphodiesterase [Bryobacteraceae bacterium]
MRRILILLALAVCSLGAAHRVEVQGHRGARARRPENTIPAFEYAISQGVDVLELDMNVTKDGVLVVSHDPVLHPPVCSGPVPQANIHDLTLAQVREWDCGKIQNPAFATQQAIPGTKMPTLDEVFNLASKGNFQFNIETKISEKKPELAPPPDEFVRLVLAAVQGHHLESRVTLQSFDFRTLREMKKLAPEIRLVALYSGPAKDFVQIAREAQADIVSPEFHLVTPEQVQAAHRAGLRVIPWTPDKPEDWDRLIAAGVDGIITDDPAALIEHLK